MVPLRMKSITSALAQGGDHSGCAYTEGTDVGSDHHLLIVRIRLKLKKKTAAPQSRLYMQLKDSEMQVLRKDTAMKS